jgi:FkbM family methyltransferase
VGPPRILGGRTVRQRIRDTVEALAGACPTIMALPARWYVRHTPWDQGTRGLSIFLDIQQRLRPHRFRTDTRFGFEISGTTEDLVQRYVYLFGVWEPDLTYWIQSRLEPGDVFVDVGANIGYFTLLAATCVGQHGRCVAIEASPSILELLNENLEINHIGSRVRAVNVAASDRDGTLTVYAGPRVNLGLTTMVPNEDLEIETTIGAKALKDILTEEEIARARLIKIDVEGFEGPVVRGLLPFLGSCRSDLEIVMEVNGMDTPDGEETSDIVRQFGALGFHAYEIANGEKDNPYLKAVRSPQRPRRVHTDTGHDHEAELIFSRVDAPSL